MVQFVDIVKGQAVSLANQGFQKAVGNLRGVVDSSLNRGQPTNNPALTPRLDPKSFTFPLDVTNSDQGLGNHGHYILFFINEQENAKIRFGKKQASSRGFANTLKAQALNGIASEVRTFVDSCWGHTACYAVSRNAGKVGNLLNSCHGDGACYGMGRDGGYVGNVSHSCYGYDACQEIAAGAHYGENVYLGGTVGSIENACGRRVFTQEYNGPYYK